MLFPFLSTIFLWILRNRVSGQQHNLLLPHGSWGARLCQCKLLALVHLKEPRSFDQVTSASLVPLRLVCGEGVGEVEPQVISSPLSDKLQKGRGICNSITEPSFFYNSRIVVGEPEVIPIPKGAHR